MGGDTAFPGRELGQPVRFSGRWLDHGTVYVSDRVREGRDGYWVVSPLLVDGSGSAMLVVRGWSPTPSAPAPEGRADVTGFLQYGEGSGQVDDNPDDDVLPELRIGSLVQRIDTDLYSGYVISRQPGTGLATVSADRRTAAVAVHGAAQPALRAPVVGVRAVRAGGLVPLVSGPARDGLPGTVVGVRGALNRYRVMATVVGVLLIVLILVGVPLKYLAADGTGPQRTGEFITTYLGIAHGYLYMIFLVTAFLLSRRARWSMPFTLVTLLCGTVPVLSFWAERRATARVRAEYPEVVSTGSTSGGSTDRGPDDRRPGLTWPRAAAPRSSSAVAACWARSRWACSARSSSATCGPTWCSAPRSVRSTG